MKALKKTERKYYKYEIDTWVQPTLTADSPMGGNTFGCTQSNLYGSEYAWRAFDGSESSGWTNNGNTGSLTFYNPNLLNITNIRVMNWFDAGYMRAIRSGSVYGSKNGITWEKIKDFTNTIYTVKALWDIDLSDNTNFYKYFRLDVVGDGSYARITELFITAREIKNVYESTIDDYDFYKDVDSHSIHKEVNRIYYGKRTFPEGSNLTTWTVPEGIDNIHIVCVASKGNGGANGGKVECDLAVSGGQTLYFTTGIMTDAYNASDVRLNGTELTDRVIVAGGGGFGGWAGAGGDLLGGHGSSSGFNSGGVGGSQTEGGAGSYLTGGSPRGGQNGTKGEFGLGGTGWTRGGAGYYGGGGGSDWDVKKVGVVYGGSGGGSSYTHPTLCSKVSHTQGFQNGNGYISINYEATPTAYDFYMDIVTAKAFK